MLIFKVFKYAYLSEINNC